MGSTLLKLHTSSCKHRFIRCTCTCLLKWHGSLFCTSAKSGCGAGLIERRRDLQGRENRMHGDNCGAQHNIFRKDKNASFDFVSWHIVRNYFHMFTFALSRSRFDKDSFRALLFLASGLFSYFVFPVRVIPTQFGLFAVKSRSNVRSTTYDCFKTNFTYLYNLRRLWIERNRQIPLV